MMHSRWWTQNGEMFWWFTILVVAIESDPFPNPLLPSAPFRNFLSRFTLVYSWSPSLRQLLFGRIEPFHWLNCGFWRVNLVWRQKVDLFGPFFLSWEQAFFCNLRWSILVVLSDRVIVHQTADSQSAWKCMKVCFMSFYLQYVAIGVLCNLKNWYTLCASSRFFVNTAKRCPNFCIWYWSHCFMLLKYWKSVNQLITSCCALKYFEIHAFIAYFDDGFIFVHECRSEHI